MKSLYYALFALLISFGLHSIALAFDSSSASFYVRQNILSNSGGNATSTYSTSASFKSYGAGGETGIGTSTSASFGISAGFLRTITLGPAPTYEQVHYHWRNDDGSESAATSATGGVQDTDISSLSKLTNTRLRIEVANSGGTIKAYSTQQFRLEYGLLSTTCSAIASWTDVGAGAGDWDMSASSNLTEGGNTTNIAVATGGVSDENHTFISSNAAVKETSSQVAAISVPSDSFLEAEFSIQALAAATAGGTYCFRLTNAGSTTNYLYTSYPKATLSSGSQFLTFSISDNTIGFGSLSASAARYATGDTLGNAAETEAHQLAASTNAGSGYSITVQGATLTSLQNGSNNISAIGGTNTGSSVGNEQFGIRATASGGIGSVSSPYAAAGFAYAGTASTASTIASAATGDSATTTYSVRYISNISPTTEYGSYSAVMTYQATANY